MSVGPDRRRHAAIEELLAEYARVAIVGGPRTGKTTLASLVKDRTVLHTDDLMQYPWAEIPAMLIAQAAPLERFVIEGVQVARALRKELVVDAVLWLDAPVVARSKGQESMAKGIASVFAEWRAGAPGVVVVEADRT